MSGKNLFVIGSKPSLEEVLENRENRFILESKLAEKYSLPVLVFKLNIPGPVKNNEIIQKVFQKGCEEIQSMLKKSNWNILYKKFLNISTGPEYFAVVNTDNERKLKKETIQLEQTEYGRIYDIDILVKNGKGEVSTINRTSLGYPERKCLICEKDAKVCSRSRAHTVEEMQKKLTEMILRNKIV